MRIQMQNINLYILAVHEIFKFDIWCNLIGTVIWKKHAEVILYNGMQLSDISMKS